MNSACALFMGDACPLYDECIRDSERSDAPPEKTQTLPEKEAAGNLLTFPKKNR